SVVAAGFPDATWILLAWLGGGLFVAIDAMPTVELGAAIPLAGGPYSIIARAIGPRSGFLIGWADWCQLTVSTGFITVAFGEYVHRLGLLPGLTAGQIAIALVAGCCLVNWIGARAGGAAGNIGSALKALGLVVLVAALFGGRGTSAAVVPPPPAFTWAAAMIALRAIYGAYGGWQAAIYFSEEVNAPERNVARATFVGIAVITTLYLLVNAAVLHVLPIGLLVQSKLAAADAARIVLGESSGIIVTALAILCVASLANIQIMELTRTNYAMARAGRLPPALAMVSASGTPRAALLVGCIATGLIIAAADSLKGQLYEILLDLYAPFVMIILLSFSIAVFRLRRAEPDLPRPWKMPLFPLPALVSMALNAALLLLFLVSDWKTGIWSAVLLACAVPLYWLGKSRWKEKAAPG
ncbi:MAG TPA: APC family permease, partial [Rhizomicrobium sp.]|nr:APC family permease [Rhizomicrobium sp.]